MRVPAVIYADEPLIDGMDDKVPEQLTNVAGLPGIVGAAYAMPDAHWGYGFPIGGVAAFDAAEGGVICAGGVGFDVSCGVRLLLSDLTTGDIEPVKTELANLLFDKVPAGVGSTGAITLDEAQMTAMLNGGAQWAIENGYGELADLERMEERGRLAGARPDSVSDHARRRQRKEMGTLGSGNHYCEVQVVGEIFDDALAKAFGLEPGGVCVSIHTGSRGLGHQIGTDYMREMVLAAPSFGIVLPDLELACAPIRSDLGQRYLGAMRAAANCAMANREIVTHLVRQVFAKMFAHGRLRLLFDVSHNTCKTEKHKVGNELRELYVHRKGATRAFGPGHPDLPEDLKPFGQPVLIGGSMGTGSYVLAGAPTGEAASFSSACHGAGRAMSRHQALKQWHGRQVQDDLALQGVIVRSPSRRGIAEEAPGAYKDVSAVVEVAEAAGLAKRVARLRPVVCVKG
jgi:tRNA-splicing ligase RtcB (3'-phosphate/5'-hydroxy nucleic acid ligase)